MSKDHFLKGPRGKGLEGKNCYFNCTFLSVKRKREGKKSYLNYILFLELKGRGEEMSGLITYPLASMRKWEKRRCCNCTFCYVKKKRGGDFFYLFIFFFTFS